MVDIEKTLTRELGEVAEGLRVPAMPPLPQRPPSARPHWQPMLVAAAAVVVVAGAVAALQAARGGDELQPAPPAPAPSASASPSPSRTAAVEEIPMSAPTIPYVLGESLYVDGEQVPGTWWSVSSGRAAWVAVGSDGSWWWGRGPQPHRFESQVDNSVVISPNGKYVAAMIVENGKGVVTGFDTSFSGEGLGGIPVDLDAPDGTPNLVRAVTDDGRVVVQGTGTSLLWLPLVDGSTVDLTTTAPEQQVVGNTAAGLLVTDGEGGDPYLAELSDAGELTPVAGAPALDAVVGSPGGTSLAGTPPGMMGGETSTVPRLEAQDVSGTPQVTLSPPDGWAFRVMSYAWEDEDHLVAEVLRDSGAPGSRMARCSLSAARCVFVQSP